MKIEIKFGNRPHGIFDKESFMKEYDNQAKAESIWQTVKLKGMFQINPKNSSELITFRKV